MNSICHIVRQYVDDHPDREFWTYRDLSDNSEYHLSYGELWSSAAGAVEAITAEANHPTVMIVLPIGIDLLRCHLAALLAGGVPVIHSHPSKKMSEETYIKHLVHVLGSVVPDVVVTNRHFLQVIEQIQTNVTCAILAVEDLPKESQFNPTQWEDRSSDDVALIQHSSGSTGLQKGVGLTHGMVIGQCASYARALSLDPDNDRICSWIPLYHDMGLFTTLLLPLLQRTRVAAIDPFQWIQDPTAFLRLIQDYDGTLCWQPNFAYNLLSMRATDEEISTLDLASMRGFINCSEPARSASHRLFYEKFHDCGVQKSTLLVCYAMAENTFAVTMSARSETGSNVLRCDSDHFSRGMIVPVEDEADLAMDIVSVGNPIDDCDVQIVDKNRSPMPAGTIGEVAIRSPFSLRSYYRNPVATQSSISETGWFFSGDLGFYWDKELYITGRQKDLIIVGGRNFYPQDIESLVDSCPLAVAGRSVAIGVDDEQSGTQRIVIIVESRGDSQDGIALSALIRKKVHKEMDCPVSEVHIVPYQWLLKTSSGKIARKPNLERYLAEFVVPVSPTILENGLNFAWTRDIPSILAWGVLLAISVYTILLLQPNFSWGVYARF